MFHWIPFQLFHQSPDSQEHVHMYSNIYNSNAMLEENAKIWTLGRDPGNDLETELAILSILLWSDSTHLTSFGTASLWLIYMYFGNLSKYIRGRPSSFVAHHLAYVPSVGINVYLSLQALSHVHLAS
jgi:Plavaka transposase